MGCKNESVSTMILGYLDILVARGSIFAVLSWKCFLISAFPFAQNRVDGCDGALQDPLSLFNFLFLVTTLS